MLDDEANTKVTGSNDYTLGGWTYIDSASEKTPLYATATIGADNTHTGAGISVTLGDGYNLVAIISDDTGKSITSSSTTGQANWGKNGAWFYFAVVMDTAAEILTLYAFTDSGTNVTSAILDYSSLTGSIGTPEGNTGSFNEDGSEQFYSTVSNMFLTVRYDNVCMWDSVLTESELTSIVQSGKPVLFSSWLDTFSDLIDDQGLVMPVAIDYSTVLSYVQADIAEYEHMHVVRHGPQQNFLGYREEYETEEAIKDKGSLAVVANPGPFPIAIVNKTDWTIVENLEEWGTYFRDLNIVQPPHWSTLPQSYHSQMNKNIGVVETRTGMVSSPAFARRLKK
ncbi:hypothetical protein C6300_01420 [Salmonella enterica]|nr:hypothetical protein [Salmonella enterica]EAP0040613.1 hypothetical protein [Salmonella enterica]MIQ10784.1 hypothetical protein [Salmonella enterica]